MADATPESSLPPTGSQEPMAAGADVADGQVPAERDPASPGPHGDGKKPGRVPPGGIGICVSGAGIRSAAFALGALQVLQQHRILKSASYLAAVSGGSYIAAAMALVAKGEIPPGSGHGPQFVKPEDDLPAFGRNSPEEKYLRNNLRYLTHGPGGRVGVAGRVMFCLLLNLLFFAGCLWVVAVPLGWVYGVLWKGLRNSASCGRSPAAQCIIHVHPNPLIWTIVVGLAIAGGLAGLVWAGVAWRAPVRRKAVGALSGVLIGLAGAVLILGIGVPYLLAFLRGTVATLPARPHAMANQGVAARRSSVPLLVGAGVGLAGSIASILGWVSAITQKITPEEKTIISWIRRFVQNHRTLTINAVAAVAGPLLTLMLALLAINFGASHIPGWHGSELEHLIFLMVPLVVLVGLYFLADLNSWSLHPYFRQHLSQAFALGRFVVSPAASQHGAGSRPRRWVKLIPAPSTSQFPLATESMEGITLPRPDPNVRANGGRQAQRSSTMVRTSAGALQDAEQRPYESPYLLSEGLASEGDFPRVLICAAANVTDYGQVPTGCNATSFVFSDDKIGGPIVGVCEVGVYEKATSSRPITIPGALAIAGAGISPEMNRLTHWPLRYLMTIANVRVGVWLPNPYLVANHLEDPSDKIRKWCWVHLLRRKEETLVYRRPSLRYLFRELLGRNHLDSHFIYVTDGRHYESLGLVELIRRQCRWIYCIDGTDDTNSFDAIGQAIALARAEEGANIQLDPREQMGAEDGGPHVSGWPDKLFARSVVAKGTVTYRDDDLGEATLIVVKAAVTQDAPWDIRSWQERHPAFPRDPAFGQFSAEHFDAYRALGEYAMTQAMAKGCPLLTGDAVVTEDMRPDGTEQQVEQPGTRESTEMV